MCSRQHIATYCNTLQHIPTRCNTLQHIVTHCNTLQHTATHCNTLQHTTLHVSATHCNTLQLTAKQHIVTSEEYSLGSFKEKVILDCKTRCNSLQHTCNNPGEECAAGSFKGQVGANACTLCPHGSYGAFDVCTFACLFCVQKTVRCCSVLQCVAV